MGNKKVLWILAVIAVVAIAAGVVYKRKSMSTQSPVVSSAPQSTGTQKEGVKKAPASPEAGLSYQQVVDKFKNLRMQFNDQCQASPTSATYKSGTRVMFDNRGAKSHTVTLDGKGYVISQYGFIVLALSSPALPHTIKVDCDKQYNAAQILLQK